MFLDIVAITIVLVALISVSILLLRDEYGRKAFAIIGGLIVFLWAIVRMGKWFY